MYNVTEQSIHKLLQSAKKLLSDLQASPIWGVIQNEQVIIDLTKAVEEVDEQVNQNEAQV
jgi:hypothetical protein